METTDLVLAILHHLLAFSLAGIVAAEFVLVRNEMSAATLARLARIDRHYGLIALLVVIVGAARVVYGLKGWEFYVYNWVFWAKMATFAAVACSRSCHDPLPVLARQAAATLPTGAAGRSWPRCAPA